MIMFAVLLISCGPGQHAGAVPQANMSDPRYQALGKSSNLSSSKWFSMRFIGNWFMDTHFLYTLGGVYNGLGDISEIMDTATRIRHTSEISWCDEWFKTATRVEKLADDALAMDHKISAGEAYLRSAHYFLSAEIFLHTNVDDPRILTTYRRAGNNFVKALRLLGVNVSVVQIPYEGMTLRGYFFRTAQSGARPILISHQGFDAAIESTWGLAEAAIKRGWHCLLFEGPGQGLTIREHGLVFRPDWENVVAPAVDFVLRQPGVDPDNIALMGISMGGGFAARAASYEHRLSAVVLDPGYVSISDMFTDMFPDKLLVMQEDDPADFDKKILELAKYDFGIRWGIHHGMWVFGAKTPSQLFSILTRYEYEADLPRITSRTLVVDAEDEEFGRGQPRRVFDLVQAPKEYMLFTRADAASLHCQTGSPAVGYAKIFDWLDENVR